MKIFIDTEFLNSGNGAPIDLISIGMVAENGEEFYGINVDAPLGRMWANRFVRHYIWPHLPLVGLQQVGAGYVGTLDWDHVHPEIQHVRQVPNLREDVYQFLVQDGPPELWGSFCGFDYVVLSQLFGTFDDHRIGVPMFIHDIRQMISGWKYLSTAIPRDLRDDLRHHHALDDAKALKREYEWCRDAMQVMGSPDGELSWDFEPEVS